MTQGASLSDLSNVTGYVQMQWTDAFRPAENFYAWRVYHRNADSLRWTKVYETLDDTDSYLVPIWQFSNAPDQALTLVEVTQDPISGQLIEGTYEHEHPFSPATDNKYWLIHPTDQTVTMKLNHVSGDPFQDSHEFVTVPLMGRGYKVNVGERQGYTGTLSGQIYDTAQAPARQLRLKLENVFERAEAVYLRNPFGDLWRVFIGQVSFTPIPGLGTQNLMEYTAPYVQVH